MTPDKEDKLIEKMARAMCAEMQPSKDPDELGPAPRGTLWLLPFWYRGYGRQARAALRISKPIIRDWALEEAKVACAGEFLTDPETHGDGDTAYDMAIMDCIAAADALKSKGQKP